MFDHLVVIGDSLSDMGNAGRYSDGPVWVEQLATQLDLPLTTSRAGGSNYAVGGALLDARAPNSLRTQAEAFVNAPRPEGRTLVIVYGGGNDLLSAMGHPRAADTVQTAVTSLEGILAGLIEHGARELLVPDLPDVGITPLIRAQGPQAVAEAGRLTAAFNSGVARMLADLGARHPAVKVHRLGVHEMAARVISDPAAYGFRDVTTPCTTRGSCAGHLFWDSIHPTTQAHALLAEAALRAL